MTISDMHGAALTVLEDRKFSAEETQEEGIASLSDEEDGLLPDAPSKYQ